MRAIRLRCEYLNDPIGVDFTHPRLMWNVEGGVKQTAYRIVTEKWDSGKVASSAMHADYPKALSDRERVNWRVCLWDENDEAGDWREAFFETGISAWQAQWITGDYAPKKNRRYPVDCFRKAFRAQSVEKARLFISEITGTDGSVQTVVTDGSWQWSSDGPIRFADNEDGEVVDASMAPSYVNHYSKGAVCEWLFDTCCGIRVDGENRFTIAPRPGGHLTHARARYDSVYGTVECGWEKKDGKTAFTVAVPANCEALVRLPDGSERILKPGIVTYSI